MKHYIFLLVLVTPILNVFAQQPGFKLEAIGSTALPVTINKMTNIVFPGPIRSAVKVSRDVLAQKVRGVENVIELKAVRRGFAATNLSVYGVDGHLYSFVLKYVDDTATLNYRVVLPDAGADIRLSGLPVDDNKLRADADQLAGQPGFMHRTNRSGRLCLTIKGIWLCDSLQWFVFSVDNYSPVAFRPASMKFYLQDAQRVARRAEQQVPINPVYSSEGHTLSGHRSGHYAVAFEPFTIPRGKRMIVRLQGEDGRTLTLRIKGGALLRGRAI